MKKKILFSLLLSIVCVLSVLIPTRVDAAGETAAWTSVWYTPMVKSTLSEVIEQKQSSLVANMISAKNNTIRMALTVQGSGEKVRFVLANDFGTSALPIKAISVGKTVTSNTRNIQSGTIKTITYNGNKNFSIPAGKRITTDAVDMSVKAGEMITVSIYYGDVEPNTIGLYGADSYTHIIGSDYTNKTSFGNTSLSKGEQLYSDDSNATGHYDLLTTLTEVDVYGTDMKGTLVIFGDSTVTNETVNYLAEELRKEGITNIAVTMAGIKGNRLAYDGAGDQADLLGIKGTERFARDVLSQANVKYAFVKLGANDIVHPNIEGMGAPYADLELMKDDYRLLASQAREAGVMYYISQIAPWKGYTRDNTVNWSLEIDQLRLDINEWIIEEHSADGKLDVGFLSDGYALYADETTDGAHPTEKGQRKLASALKWIFVAEE